jgi:flagellar biosynthesis/type III secretory pathway protein FliH
MVPTAASQKLAQARATCRELLAALIEENTGALSADTAATEARLLHKKRLTLRLEQLLAETRAQRESWREDPAAQAEALALETEFRLLQESGRQNVALLKAAHQVRAELVMAIRDTLDANTPKAQLYGNNGALYVIDGATRLMAREV